MNLKKGSGKYMLELVIFALLVLIFTAIIFFIAGFYAGRAYENVKVEDIIERYYPGIAAPGDDIKQNY